MMERLPRKCFSILPETGERILIWRGQNEPIIFNSSEGGAELRASVDRDNARWSVTKAQEAAMLAGFLQGWPEKSHDREAR